ncbi:MAG: MOSC domain-containing protein, partial [Rhodospirillales bacterium]|nr:MOSC domain-containing protein [Rhodospirillales bacterium]
APHFYHVPGHVFGDQKRPVISMINQASLAELERAAGARRQRRRFRANIWFSGAPAWAEFAWVGSELMVGGARLSVTRRITRCPATEVNPDTGLRDADPVAELKAAFGHADLGVHAEIVGGGTIALGDAIEVLPA